MPPRNLFIGILALTLLLAGCRATPTPRVTLVPPTRSPATSTPIPPTNPPAETGTEIPIPATETPLPVVVQLPDPAGYTWKLVASGLSQPTDITGAADGSNRLFVLEKVGRIRIIQDDQPQPASFLDISDRVGSNSSEQGLLGLAFHPRFYENGYFFVNYTDRSGNTRISRFTANGDTADPASEKRFLAVPQPFANHNGGAVKFGPDGYLYIALGDGGSQGDPYDNAQSGNSLLGKILRIDVDNGDPYAIPPDNPYAGSGEVYQEIWAYGLRNPWRFSFDPLTGDIWIGDVGQSSREEINRAPSGAPGGYNFGWNEMEGTLPFEGNNRPEYTAPVAEYTRSFGCSVTGGYVYSGQAMPEWQGIYFYGDYCSGAVWALPASADMVPTAENAAASAPLFQTGFSISTFGVDEAGELYVSDYSKGAIYRLEKK
jgi:glucose/arabinose dehydrogenase